MLSLTIAHWAEMKKHSRGGSTSPAHPIPAWNPVRFTGSANGESIVSILKKRAELNRRKHLRFPANPRLARLRMALQGTGRDAVRPIRGQIHDFGTGRSEERRVGKECR